MQSCQQCRRGRMRARTQIILIENDELINDYKQIIEVMNDYFLNAVEMLEIPKNLDIINDTTHAKDTVCFLHRLITLSKS